MKISLQYMDQLQGISDWQVAKGFVRQQFEDLASQIIAGWNTNHNADGTHNFEAIGNTGLNSIPRDTLANIPTTLGPTDQGYLYYVSDYGHTVRWSGSIWEFAPGDVGNGFLRAFFITPQETGWSLCDGSTVNYLVVGAATLSTTPITLPNLSGSPAYAKFGAAYAGIVAGSGSTSSDGDHSHTLPDTDNESAHTHTFTTGSPSATLQICQDNVTFSAGDEFHTHSGTTSAGSAHKHTFSSNTGTTGAHTHTAGTMDPAHLTALPYFRK